MKTFIALFSLLRSLSAIGADSPTYLFLQHAEHAELKRTHEQYTLILHQVPESVTFFTEWPNRTVGTVPLYHLLKLWQTKNRIILVLTHQIPYSPVC